MLDKFALNTFVKGQTSLEKTLFDFLRKCQLSLMEKRMDKNLKYIMCGGK